MIEEMQVNCYIATVLADSKCLKRNLSLSFSRQQHGRSETEEYSSESESESEDEEELQVILEDLQRQNEELEVRFGS